MYCYCRRPYFFHILGGRIFCYKYGGRKFLRRIGICTLGYTASYSKILILGLICFLAVRVPAIILPIIFGTVVPHTEYFILFCIFHFNFELPQNKQEGQITYHSHSNRKVVGTAENCC